MECKDEKVAMTDDAVTMHTAESLDTQDLSGMIVLRAAEGKKEYSISKKDAFIAKLIATSCEQDVDAVDVPVPAVKEATFEHIYAYMKHHAGVEPPIIEKPLRSKNMKDVCKDKWDADFIDAIGNNRQDLYDLILGSNYMDIKSLLHLGCAKVASLIKGQPLEKIKDILAVDQAANKRAEQPDPVIQTPGPCAPEPEKTESIAA